MYTFSQEYTLLLSQATTCQITRGIALLFTTLLNSPVKGRSQIWRQLAQDSYFTLQYFNKVATSWWHSFTVLRIFFFFFLPWNKYIAEETYREKGFVLKFLFNSLQPDWRQKYTWWFKKMLYFIMINSCNLKRWLRTSQFKWKMSSLETECADLQNMLNSIGDITEKCPSESTHLS